MSFGISWQPLKQPLRFGNLYVKTGSAPSDEEIEAIAKQEGIRKNNIKKDIWQKSFGQSHFVLTGDDAYYGAENDKVGKFGDFVATMTIQQMPQVRRRPSPVKEESE